MKNNRYRDNVTGNIIAVLITLIFATCTLLTLLGFVDVKDPATTGIVSIILSTSGSFVMQGVIYKYFNKNIGDNKDEDDTTIH